MYTHPDSVKRVKPPKMTMPNTLTALPRSQYATDLSLVSGKPLFPVPTDDLGEGVSIFLNIWLRWIRKAVDCDRDRDWSGDWNSWNGFGRRALDEHCTRLEMSCRARAGAVCHSGEKPFSSEAIAMAWTSEAMHDVLKKNLEPGQDQI
jgi:hypothetical protein